MEDLDSGHLVFIASVVISYRPFVFFNYLHLIVININIKLKTIWFSVWPSMLFRFCVSPHLKDFGIKNPDAIRSGILSKHCFICVFFCNFIIEHNLEKDE